MLVCLIIVCRVVSIFILVVITSFKVMPVFKLVGLMIYQRPPRGVLQIRPKDVITRMRLMHFPNCNALLKSLPWL